MKKVLLGSTAIIAAGMIAAPTAMAAEKLQASVGGYMEQWFGYTSADDSTTADYDQFNIVSDTEIYFAGSTVLDNGIEFGINVQLEGNQGGDQIDESYLIVKGSFGEINLGSENSSLYKMTYSAPDYGIGLNSGDQTAWVPQSGVGNLFRGATGSVNLEPDVSVNDTEKLTYYTPRFGGFQLGASYIPDVSEDSNGVSDTSTGLHDGVTIGANYQGDFGGASLGVSAAYGTMNREGSTTDDPEAYAFGLNVGIGGFEVGAAYAKNENGSSGDGEGYNLGVGYSAGPWGISLSTFIGEQESNALGGVNGEMNTYHLSGKYALGPGVTAAATLGYTEFENDTANTDSDGTYFVTGIKLSF